jgi:medium-chain acyl-[acyl-carrier-protein] hydrolase
MSLWFPGARSNPNAAIRLFCFAHAGGGASGFARWPRHLPPHIAVISCQLPGHEERLREPTIEQMPPLLDALIPDLLPLLDRPFAFFGHSLGSWIGYGILRRLRQAGGPLPIRFFVSSCRAPHLPPRVGPIHQLAPQLMIDEIQRRYGAIPAPILEDRDLMDMFIRVLRSDFALFESAEFPPEPPLPCPITAFGGTEDPIVGPADIQAWSTHTAAPGFQFRPIPGGHHYLRDFPPALFQEITAALAVSEPES